MSGIDHSHGDGRLLQALLAVHHDTRARPDIEGFVDERRWSRRCAVTVAGSSGVAPALAAAERPAGACAHA